MTVFRSWLCCLALMMSLMLVRSWGADQSGDLIRFLTYQSARDGKASVLAGLSGCGQYEADRAAARSLIKMGDSAATDLEQALDSIQAQGSGSQYALNAAWLMAAYAKIRGRDAFPRFRRMLDDPKLISFLRDLDASAAVSLGLTSYVSGPRPLTREFNCGRGQQPKDALDQLIIAWELNDGRWLNSN